VSEPVGSAVTDGEVPNPLVRANGAPKLVPLIRSCTEPVGLIVPPAVSATVAVKVTVWPNTDGFTEEPIEIIVAAGLTVNAKVTLAGQGPTGVGVLSSTATVTMNVPACVGIPVRGISDAPVCPRVMPGGRPLALNIYGGIPPLAVMNWVLPCPTVPVTGDGGVTVIIGQVAAVTVKFIVAVPPGPPITMPTRPGVAPAGTEVSI